MGIVIQSGSADPDPDQLHFINVIHGMGARAITGYHGRTGNVIQSGSADPDPDQLHFER